MEKMTREEALQLAKHRMIVSGGFARIKSRNGFWYDTKTDEWLTHEEAYALIPDTAIDEAYIDALINGEETSYINSYLE